VRGKNGVDTGVSRGRFTHNLVRYYHQEQHGIEEGPFHISKYQCSCEKTKRPLANKRTGVRNSVNFGSLTNHSGTEKVQHLLDRIGDRVNAASREEQTNRMWVGCNIFHH
jgi:hypothetical protein